MAQTCAVERQFFRMLNRIVEPRIRAGWGSPRFVPGGVIVLETRGRRTGRRYRTPLAAVRLQGHTIVSTFRGGRSEWVKNLVARPEVRYWLGGRPRPARALVLAPGGSRPDTRRLPRGLRGLLSILSPYTRAGWAFAVLAPETAAAAASPVVRKRSERPSRAGRRRRALRRGATERPRTRERS